MDIDGEHLTMTERIVVSPAAGIFTPTEHAIDTVEVGATIGYVRVGDDDVPVRSPFGGRIMAVVAVAGERLLPQQRVAWMRAA